MILLPKIKLKKSNYLQITRKIKKHQLRIRMIIYFSTHFKEEKP